MAEELLNVLTSVREKLKDIHIDDDTALKDVKKEYRKLLYLQNRP